MEEKGSSRAYCRADDVGSREVVVCEKKGVFTAGSYQAPPQTQLVEGAVKIVLQSCNGGHVVTASDSVLTIWRRDDKHIVLQSTHKFLYSVTLSPRESLLQVLERVSASEGRSFLLAFPSGILRAQFKETPRSNYYLSHCFPLVRFAADDSYFHYDSGVITHFGQEHQTLRTIATGSRQLYEVSPISTSHHFFLACCDLDQQKKEGNLSLFADCTQGPLYEKQIKKAEEVKIRFSPVSNQFLMQLQTYYDPSGKSYYGEYGLFLFDQDKKKLMQVPTEKGPVHDFGWDRSGTTFIVISGFMPARITQFDRTNKQLFTFESENKNQLIWGNLGRFVAFGGFGNLNGEVDVWDLQTHTKVGAFVAEYCSYCSFAPDDRKLIAAVLTPRLRVDNCYKVFSYTGVLLHCSDFKHTELYKAEWRATLRHTKDVPRGLSPNRTCASIVQKTTKKPMSFSEAMGLNNYTAPNLVYKKEDQFQEEQLIPGQHPSLVKKKKKRVRPPKKQASEEP